MQWKSEGIQGIRLLRRRKNIFAFSSIDRGYLERIRVDQLNWLKERSEGRAGGEEGFAGTELGNHGVNWDTVFQIT